MPPKKAPERSGNREDEKQRDVRSSNIVAARAVADAVRTSLGPKGMDKMISGQSGDVIITNDGATILKELRLVHPAARMLVDLSKSQDVEAGDGTTSVVVIAGALLGATQDLMNKGLHPSVIAESFNVAGSKCREVLQGMSVPIKTRDREELIKAAVTSLNSKVVSQYSSLLAPVAVDAVLHSIGKSDTSNVNLKDIRVVAKLGGTVDDTELVPGMVFKQRASGAAGSPTRVENAKIAFIQFQLSAPKPYIESNVVVNDYQAMDRIFKEERQYILQMVKKIKDTGANVLLVQKSILRDAVTDVSLQLLAKLKILVVQDIDRDDVDFICKSCGCEPMPSIEAVSAKKLGHAALVEEVGSAEGRCVKITGAKKESSVVSILVRASNALMLGEAERSIHDALCVIRSLVKQPALLPGGGAPEIECAVALSHAATLNPGALGYCMKAYAEALEVVPYTLAENAGLHPMRIVTDLRLAHTAGKKHTGINVRKGAVTDMVEEQVVQPLLVSQSAIALATETVVLMLKIDDICVTR